VVFRRSMRRLISVLYWLGKMASTSDSVRALGFRNMVCLSAKSSGCTSVTKALPGKIVGSLTKHGEQYRLIYSSTFVREDIVHRKGG